MKPRAADRSTDRRGQEIRECLRDHGVDLDESFDDDESLIDSGLLDSLALFQLVLWVEGKVGRPIDPSTVDLAREWDSIRLILRYVDRLAEESTVSISTAKPSKRSIRKSGEIEIVRYTTAYKRAVAELQSRLWSEEPERNLRYLEWKYEENPLGIEPHIYLALRRDQIIGMRGFYGSRWSAGEPAEDHDVLVADDLLVRENWRNQGVVHQVMQAALDDLGARGESLVFNLSGGPITVLGSLAMGWRTAGPLAPIARRSPKRRWQSRMQQATEVFPAPFLRLDDLASPVIASNGIPVHVSREPQSDRMARLVSRSPRDRRIRHVRDAAYFAWRLRNPLHEYRFLYVGNEALDGYLVLRWRTRSADALVSIVDLEFSDDPTRQALIELATRPGLIRELDAWSATLDRSTNDHLSRVGFKPARPAHAVKGHPCILVRTIENGRSEAPWQLHGVPLLDMHNWDMRMIYSMAG
jgi:GNAT superfamily N-acetyltransferase/acyl carrier protein